MKGHERPLTFLRFNRDGDLLFSCAKDHHPTVWYADNGERIGTYNGHNGAVWCCDVTSEAFPAAVFTGISVWGMDQRVCGAFSIFAEVEVTSMFPGHTKIVCNLIIL